MDKDLNSLLAAASGSSLVSKKNDVQDSDKYSDRKNIGGLNPKWEEFFVDKVKKKGGGSYTAYIRTAIYEKMIKDGFVE